MLTIIDNKQLSNFSGDAMTKAVEFLMLNYELIIQGIDAHDKTIKKYLSDLKLFIDFIEQEGLSIDTYRNYKKMLKAMTTIATKTKNGKLVAAKVLLKELFAKGFLKIDITANVKGFKITQEHVKDGLTAKDVDNIKRIIDTTNDNLKKHKLQAIFFLLAFQGLRQFEVCALTVEDCKLADDTIFVTGKGRDDKERIDLHPDTKAALQKYINVSEKEA